MPTEIKGAIALRKAIKNFSPDLAKETQNELGSLLKPITAKARGFIPSQSPLSGWGKSSSTIWGTDRKWSTGKAKRGIGYKTTPSRPNDKGFRALARIVNASAAGSIYETAGRLNPNGREQAPMARVVRESQANYGKMIRSGNKQQSRSNNPAAGSMFIEAMNQYGQIVDANNQTGAGRRTRKMKGRAIFRAWKEDGGKTNAAVVRAIENSKDKFYASLGAK
jgi:hypothetical protein